MPKIFVFGHVDISYDRFLELYEAPLRNLAADPKTIFLLGGASGVDTYAFGFLSHTLNVSPHRIILYTLVSNHSPFFGCSILGSFSSMTQRDKQMIEDCDSILGFARSREEAKALYGDTHQEGKKSGPEQNLERFAEKQNEQARLEEEKGGLKSFTEQALLDQIDFLQRQLASSEATSKAFLDLRSKQLEAMEKERDEWKEKWESGQSVSIQMPIQKISDEELIRAYEASARKEKKQQIEESFSQRQPHPKHTPLPPESLATTLYPTGSEPEQEDVPFSRTGYSIQAGPPWETLSEEEKQERTKTKWELMQQIQEASSVGPCDLCGAKEVGVLHVMSCPVIGIGQERKNSCETCKQPGAETFNINDPKYKPISAAGYRVRLESTAVGDIDSVVRSPHWGGHTHSKE